MRKPVPFGTGFCFIIIIRAIYLKNCAGNKFVEYVPYQNYQDVLMKRKK